MGNNRNLRQMKEDSKSFMIKLVNISIFWNNFLSSNNEINRLTQQWKLIAPWFLKLPLPD